MSQIGQENSSALASPDDPLACDDDVASLLDAASLFNAASLLDAAPLVERRLQKLKIKKIFP